jgi:hypothetical protein
MPDSPTPIPLPRAVAWLGYGGLLPFLGLAAAVLLQVQPQLARAALLAYGAVILSFVGALHWGFAMLLPGLGEAARTRLFAWSTVPALVAWPALLAPVQAGAFILMAGFIAHYLQDRRLAQRQVLPAWYLPMRLRLSSVACLCLVTLLRG